ncbi:MAG TPA: hypothetical protein VHW00_14955 [Thermoanaerobaculia bacterium]|nr:hypothetical protein [Thermoanaerobaculia bacterium]
MSSRISRFAFFLVALLLTATLFTITNVTNPVQIAQTANSSGLRVTSAIRCSIVA